MRVSSFILLGIVLIEVPIVISFAYKFNNVLCEASEQKTCSNTFCYLSTSEKSVSLANFGCTLTRPLNSLNLTTQLFFKTGNAYRQILKTPSIDWITFISGKKLNPFYDKLIQIVEKSAPNFFRKLPWTGNMEVYNLSLEDHDSFISMFPKGVYKSVSWIGDELDECVIKTTLIMEIGRY